MTLRYAVKLGDTTYPVGTAVRRATLDEMQTVWPTIENKGNSIQVGVWFPGLDKPTIVLLKQVIL